MVRTSSIFDECFVSGRAKTHSDQNMVSGAMNQHPEAVLISESGKQIGTSSDVGSVGLGHVVVARSDQFLICSRQVRSSQKRRQMCDPDLLQSCSGWDARSREQSLGVLGFNHCGTLSGSYAVNAADINSFGIITS